MAKSLGDLNEKIVFVGGAVVSVYADDPAADEVRPTDDIDFTLELTGYGDWVALNEKLMAIGFSPNPEGHAMCNFLYQGIEIDVMPSENSAIGTTNRWYKPGFEFVKEITIGGQKVRVLSVPFYLATKFEAFNDRGVDYRTSHDFEDIIYVIDNCTTVVKEISEAEEKVKSFIKDELRKVLGNSNVVEIIQSQVHPNMAAGRYPLILTKIKEIVS
ncbi:MAG TPA: nucleotidyl transferase AbiEii/AbiGii toxin family protein [Bacteroidia bacterium]|nr:nucleotidyl transferase AbiEii/AbiGii toxin family protein [Bacteroidia bacterium]